MCEESISLDTNAAPLCIVCAVSFALSEASRGNIKGWIQYNVKGKLTASLEEKVYTFWPIRLLPVQIETGEYENKKFPQTGSTLMKKNTFPSFWPTAPWLAYGF